MKALKLLPLLFGAVLLVAGCGGSTSSEVAKLVSGVPDSQAASSSESDGLRITCSLDDPTQLVTCEASGYTESADRLYWWTKPEQGEAAGETFAFTITRPYSEQSIMFEACTSGSCQTFTVTLDTAHLMSSESEAATPTQDGTAAESRASRPPVGTPDVHVRGAGLGGRPCTTLSDPKPRFTHEVVPQAEIKSTAPPGSVFSGMLKRHAYFFVGSGIPVQEWLGYPRSVPISTPIESSLHSVHLYEVVVAGEDVIEYEFMFEVSCEVWYRLGHIGPVADRIAALGPFQLGDNRVDDPLQFEGGELVGYWSGANPGGNMDLGVFNTTVEQTLANPERMTDGYHDQQLYEDCPFDYFPEELRLTYHSLLAEENTAEPVQTEHCRRSAEHDVAGTISGEWFVADRYSPVIAIGTSLLGSARVSFSEYMVPGGTDLSVSPDQPTYVHPTQVTDEHCYHRLGQDVYANVKLLSPMKLKVEYGSGSCTARTPIVTLTLER